MSAPDKQMRSRAACWSLVWVQTVKRLLLNRQIGFRNDSIWVAAITLAGLSLFVAEPLFSCEWYMSHEVTHPLLRVIALSEEIRQGDFYPRWLSLTYLGKGSPFFNFYSPASYLFPAYLHAAGLPLLLSIKGTCVLVFFVGAWGMYLWSKLHFQHLGGLIAAIVYLFIPYHFVDIYVRGAFAEFAALALLPYLFLSIDLTLESPKSFLRVVLISVSSAAILLTHHLSALMVMPLAIVYSLLRIISMGHKGGHIGKLSMGTVLGAGLSCFYWLPILMEKQYLYDIKSTLISGDFDVKKHFVAPGQWFSTFWGFGPSLGPRAPDGMSFQLGVVLLGCLVLSLMTLFSTDNTRRKSTLLLLFCGGFALFLTTSASAFVYGLFNVLALIQFPWRFLGPSTLFFAASCGVLAMNRVIRRYMLPFLVLLVILSIFFSTKQRTVSQPIVMDIENSTGWLIQTQTFGPLCGANEYLPRDVPLEMIKLRTDGKPNAPTGEISQLIIKGKTMRMVLGGREVQNPVTVPWHYFPGWEATIDGQSVPVLSSPEGFLQLIAPQGAHEITVRFGTTPPRMFGWFVSCFTVAGILWVGFMRRRNLHSMV